MKTIHIRDTEAFHRALDHIAGRAPIRAHLVATRDTALQQIHDTHDPQIAAIDEDIKAHLEAAEAYATAYRTELLPKGIKTAETTLATWGFRTGQPVLKLLTRKHTWTTVLERLKATPAYKAYIRTKEEPDAVSIGSKVNMAYLRCA